MQIAILLSTYNGEPYLREQLESVLKQTYTNWKLYIRDDGSTDATLAIINSYVEKYPDKIKLIMDDAGNLRSAASFMKLLENVQADYYMFCDQDDVWLPTKIEKTLNKLNVVEAQHPDKPVLVFTDLAVVDAGLQPINNSMWKYSDIDPENAKNFYRTTCLSSVTGCTVMINNLLKAKILPYPKTARMHDWWMCLNAAHYGVVDYVNEATILYRQHGRNVLGAETIDKNYYLNKLRSLRKTINDNIKVFRMLNSLRFHVSFFKVAVTKIKIISSK